MSYTSPWPCVDKVETAQALLRNDRRDINATLGPYGKTCLFIAVEKNRVELIKWLLAHGANPDPDNWHPLSEAIKRNYVQVAAIIGAAMVKRGVEFRHYATWLLKIKTVEMARGLIGDGKPWDFNSYELSQRRHSIPSASVRLWLDVMLNTSPLGRACVLRDYELVRKLLPSAVGAVYMETLRQLCTCTDVARGATEEDPKCTALVEAAQRPWKPRTNSSGNSQLYPRSANAYVIYLLMLRARLQNDAEEEQDDAAKRRCMSMSATSPPTESTWLNHVVPFLVYRTKLCEAIAGNDRARVQYIVRTHEADVCVEMDNKWTPLQHATRCGLGVMIDVIFGLKKEMGY